MDLAHTLRDILVVLVAAKLAAEVAERVGIPAVVGEIIAGVLVGPSVFHLVGGSDDVLRTLGEIGVILLLLQVGLEMDIAELGRVGRASLLVATVGVITPMALGIGAMELVGRDFNTALFVGAALTATSVGITARVFGDLRALATTEARIVLGAAVADDVMGLVVLTVVVRIVTEGSVSVVSVGGIVLAAVAFLVVGGFVGLRVAPPLFAFVERGSRSAGTVVALALAFTLAFAQVADAAKLAPIVGAFVAGIALSRTSQADRIGRELAPVGHLFVPVFFLEIGIDVQISAFGRGAVLRDALLLLAVAAAGKLVSPIGAIGTPSDKPLIGLGMLPRGEVGLIFATIGLQSGVLDQDLYAALLLVVLVTTLATPQLLKIRYARLRRDRHAAAGGLEPAEALRLALTTAIDAAHGPPPAAVLERLADLGEPVRWDADLLGRFLDVVERGNARSWRFLEVSGVLDWALPEAARALRKRREAYGIVDPLHGYRLVSMQRLRLLDADDPIVTALRSLEHVDALLLAAFLVDVFDEEPDPTADATAVVRRLGVDADDAGRVLALVADRDLLWSAARQPGAMTEPAVLRLAAHFDSPERATAAYVLAALRAEGRERWEGQRLHALHDLVDAVLRSPSLDGDRTVVDRRRSDATALADDAARALIADAPRGYVLAEAPATIARHAGLLVRSGRLLVDVVGPGEIDVGARDQPGLLAAVTGALSDAGLDVDRAVVATWADGRALESFRVRGAVPDADALTAAITERLHAGYDAAPRPEATASFDDDASPWHTVCEVRSPDRPGLLHAIACAFAAAGVEVHTATIAEDEGTVVDRFEVTDRHGAKLGSEQQETVRRLVESGVHARRRRRWLSRL